MLPVLFRADYAPSLLQLEMKAETEHGCFLLYLPKSGCAVG